MGWIIIFALKPLIQISSTGLLIWVLIGGACYTLRVFFYAIKKIPYSHAIWHLFVLAGSIYKPLLCLFYIIKTRKIIKSYIFLHKAFSIAFNITLLLAVAPVIVSTFSDPHFCR